MLERLLVTDWPVRTLHQSEGPRAARRRASRWGPVNGARAAAVLLLLSVSPAGAQQGVQLPDAVRPGASPLDRQLPGFRLPELPGQVINVPPVYERPLALDEGPRIYVKSFDITGLPDQAQRGIDPVEILEIVERQRVERQGLSLQDQELTREELRTIADYYAIIARRRTDDERLRIYEALVKQIRDRLAVEQSRGLTLGELQEIANSVTAYYREAGYFLATAVLPQQTVEDGVVEIRVLEGKLGKVLVSGNQDYSDKTLRAPFRDLIGEPVTQAEIEGALLNLTDYPGLTAFGLFQRGENIGETDLSVQVQDERLNEPTLSLDNHGNDTTGEYRLRLDYARNNLFGAADSIKGSLLVAFEPENTLFGSLEYQIPLSRPDYRLGVGAARNTFDVGGEFASSEVSGITDNANVFVRKQFQRGRQSNLHGLVDLAIKRAETQIRSTTTSEDRLTVLTFEVGYDFLDQRFAGLNQFIARLSHGFGDVFGSLQDENDPRASRRGQTARAGGEFDKLTASFFRLQTLTESQNLFIRLDLQASDDLLVPLEQSSLGGPDSVRGYPVGEFLRDSSAFASLEWSINAPFFGDKPAFRGLTWAQVLRVAVFYDYGWGEIKDPLSNELETITLRSAGIGGTLTVEDRLSAKLDVAWPLTDEVPTNARDPQYWFNLSYAF